VWKEIKISSWMDLIKKLDDMKEKRMVYRGQPNHNWTLETSFKREIGLFSKLKKENESIELMLIRLEKEMISNFKSQYHLYTNDLLNDNNDLYNLSVLQHYGAPTRLLDWSYSPFISTFFAVNSNFNDDASIFALNLEYITQVNQIKVDEFRVLTNSNSKSIDIIGYGKHYADFKDRSKDESYDEKIILMGYEPEKKNIRLARQQGLFLVSSKIDVTFEEILSSYNIVNGSNEDSDDIAIKLVIDKNIKMELINNLQMMNISNEILFPEMEGYCKSIKYRLLQRNKVN
jgi:hypothetical protein